MIILSLSLWLAATGLPAGAAPTITIEDCDLNGADVRRLLEIETKGVDKSHALPVHVLVRCSGDVAELAIQHQDGAAPTRTSLDLTGAPPLARARIVALSVADLLAWPQATPPPPKASTSAAAADIGERHGDSDRPRTPMASQWTLSLQGQLRAFASTAVHLWGPALAVTHQRGAWAQSASCAFERGVAARPLANVRIHAWTASLAGWWLHDTAFGRLRVGLGAQLERYVLEGATENPTAQLHTLTALTSAPFGAAGWAARVLPWAELDVALTAGYTLAPVTALIGDRDRVRLDGPWLGLRVSISWIMTRTS